MGTEEAKHSYHAAKTDTVSKANEITGWMLEIIFQGS